MKLLSENIPSLIPKLSKDIKKKLIMPIITITMFVCIHQLDTNTAEIKGTNLVSRSLAIMKIEKINKNFMLEIIFFAGITIQIITFQKKKNMCVCT